MAKYKLTTSNGKTRLIECLVLDTQAGRNQYLVEFSNGVRRNIAKSKITDFDVIDEAIIDRLKTAGKAIVDTAKKAGSAIASAAKNLWDDIVKIGRRVFFAINGDPIPAISPVNLATSAQSLKGVTFIPSENLDETASILGASIQETVDDAAAQKAEAKEINDYWKKFIEFRKKNKDIFDEVENTAEAANESLISDIKAGRLNEVNYKASEEAQKDYFESEIGLNVSRNELVHMINMRFRSQIQASRAMYRSKDFDFSRTGIGDVETDENGNVTKVQNSTLVPLLIWGAPGIGKSQIVSNMTKQWRTLGINASFCGIDLATMRFDDLLFPVVEEKSGKTKKEVDEKVVKDYIKEGLIPAFELPDPDDPDYEEEVIKRDTICNGGIPGETEGDGGIFFLDELSRINEDLMTVLMTLLQKRTIASGRYAIGSKWLIVAASNRMKDMPRGDFKWDQAWSGRFSMVNFVPKFEEWINYAQQIGVDDLIIRFLKANPQYWVTVAENPKESEVVMAANPRAWVQISAEIKNALKNEKIAASNASDDPFDKLDQATDTEDVKLVRTDQHGNINPNDYDRFARTAVSSDVASSLATFAKHGQNFTPEDAEMVMKLGDKYRVRVNTGSPDWPKFVIPTIFGDAAELGTDFQDIKGQRLEDGVAQKKFGYGPGNPMPPKVLNNIVDWLLKAARLPKDPNDTENQTPYKALFDWTSPLTKKTYPVYYISSSAVIENIKAYFERAISRVGITGLMLKEPGYNDAIKKFIEVIKNNRIAQQEYNKKLNFEEETE